MSSTSIVLSTEDQVIKAETIQALDYAGSGYSFASANNDNEKFRLMFPDSDIAKAYKQKQKLPMSFSMALHHISKRRFWQKYVTNLLHSNLMKLLQSKSKNNMMVMCNTGHQRPIRLLTSTVDPCLSAIAQALICWNILNSLETILFGTQTFCFISAWMAPMLF